MNKPKNNFNEKYLFWITLILSLFINNIGVLSQEVIAAGGQYNKNDNGSISYTIGEPVIDTYKGTSLTLTQGFQQTYLLVTAINESKDLNLEIIVFPNPTQDFIRLKMDQEHSSNVQYMLIDEAGHLIQQNRIFENETDIFITNLPSAHYILTIFNDHKALKSFQIVKSQKP